MCTALKAGTLALATGEPTADAALAEIDAVIMDADTDLLAKIQSALQVILERSNARRAMREQEEKEAAEGGDKKRQRRATGAPRRLMTVAESFAEEEEKKRKTAAIGPVLPAPVPAPVPTHARSTRAAALVPTAPLPTALAPSRVPAAKASRPTRARGAAAPGVEASAAATPDSAAPAPASSTSASLAIVAPAAAATTAACPEGASESHAAGLLQTIARDGLPKVADDDCPQSVVKARKELTRSSGQACSVVVQSPATYDELGVTELGRCRAGKLLRDRLARVAADEKSVHQVRA